MSRQLVLIRHAQAESQHTVEDSKRKLTAKGKSDATELGFLLKEQSLRRPMLFCSPAERTLNTARLIAPAIGIEPDEIVVENMLYQASVGDLFRFINGLENRWDTVVIVGHNPTISYMAEYLTSQPQLNFSPGSAAIIHFLLPEWKMITQRAGSLVSFKTVF